MCDTMVVLGAVAASGRTTLAKNSDREPNEAQYLFQAPPATHAAGARVRCTHVDIAQVPKTYGVIGSQPWWMWGFEHGVNECGVAIGNEAVWSRLPAGREPGLLGMDLLRLALERAATADEALDVLTGLLEQHGQSGRCARTRDMFYHNSFLIADPYGAWVLQTAGRHWVAKRVTGTATISNVYSIGADHDRISAEAESFATAQGWYEPGRGAPFDFAAAFADTSLESYPSCAARFGLSQTGIAGLQAKGAVTLEALMALLRSHGAAADADPLWRPGQDGESVLCMHARSAAGFETAASMVAELPRPGEDPRAALTYWASMASPCLSAFVPVWVDAGIPAAWTRPAAGAPDAWWSRERGQRAVERDYGTYAGAARAILSQIETRTLAAVRALPPTASPDMHAAATAAAVDAQAQAWRILADLTAALAAGPLPPRPDDPRGPYLDVVAAEAPDTSWPAGVRQAAE